MANIQIPKLYFLNNYKKEYYNYKERLVNEIIQNSVDAGASEIRIEFGADFYSILDDGHGMSRERMTEAMLTMGGSIKENSNVGGFGNSKLLVCFSHKSYLIHSLDTYVEGACLDYEFISKEFLQGTFIKCHFWPEFGYNADEMIRIAKDFLRKCNLKCNIFINGEKFTEWLDIPFIKKEACGNLHVQEKADWNYIYIRKNGLYMFYDYINRLNMQVVIEVTAPSLECFSQNRDAFKGDYKTFYSALRDRIVTDKRSFYLERRRKFIYEGKKKFWSYLIDKLEKIDNELINIEEKNEMIAAVQVMAVSDLEHPVILERFEKMIEQRSTELQRIAKDVLQDATERLDVTFIINLADSEYTAPPPMLDPLLGEEKYKLLASLWKVMIFEVLKITELELNFVIGWTLDSSTRASCEKNNKDNRYELLLNPLDKEIPYGKERELTCYVMTRALHEISHAESIQNHYDCHHNEVWADIFTQMLNKFLLKTRKSRELYNEAVEFVM
jgi:hypothetical protein